MEGLGSREGVDLRHVGLTGEDYCRQSEPLEYRQSLFERMALIGNQFLYL